MLQTNPCIQYTVIHNVQMNLNTVWGSGLYVTHVSLGPPESTSQTASRSVQPFWTVVLSVLSCLSVTLVHCGEIVGWIKMPLGMEVGLSPGNTVLDGEPAPFRPSPQKGHSSPHFSAQCSGTVAHAELLLHNSRKRVPILYNGPPVFPSKLPLLMGGSRPFLGPTRVLNRKGI